LDEIIGFSETVAERVFCIVRRTAIVPLDGTARSETDDKRKDQHRRGDNPGCFTAYEYVNRHQHRHEPGNDEDIGHSVHAGIDTHRNTHCNEVHVVVESGSIAVGPRSGKHIVRRQWPPDPLQLELTDRLDLDGAKIATAARQMR
jgi:hypothetical protein